MSKLIKKVTTESLLYQEEALKALRQLDDLIDDVDLDDSESEKVKKLLFEAKNKINHSVEWIFAINEG